MITELCDAPRNIFLEVYFDPELDMRWHVTEWLYRGRFNPEQAMHSTCPKSWNGRRAAHTWASSQRKLRLAAGYRVKLTVQSHHDAMVTAVVRDQTPGQPERAKQGISPVHEQGPPEGRTSGRACRRAVKGD